MGGGHQPEGSSLGWRDADAARWTAWPGARRSGPAQTRLGLRATVCSGSFTLEDRTWHWQRKSASAREPSLQNKSARRPAAGSAARPTAPSLRRWCSPHRRLRRPEGSGPQSTLGRSGRVACTRLERAGGDCAAGAYKTIRPPVRNAWQPPPARTWRLCVACHCARLRSAVGCKNASDWKPLRAPRRMTPPPRRPPRLHRRVARQLLRPHGRLRCRAPGQACHRAVGLLPPVRPRA